MQVALLLACLITRMLTTIYYIADPDSLRFALAVSDYDLASLRPHFPGYPVFCFIARLLTFIMGKFSLAFSVIGGLSIYAIIFYSCRMVRAMQWTVSPWILAILIFLNPMMWIMGNRYMPDLAGLAVATAAISLFITGEKNTKHNYIFFFLTGILAGTRLSYLPILLLPLAWAFIKREQKVMQLLVLSAGVLVWLVPLVIDTGWNELIEVASRHTEGHFYEWGGTIETEPSLGLRSKLFAQSIFADGLGGWWMVRSFYTIVFSILAVLTMGIAVVRLMRGSRQGLFTPLRSILLLSILFYAGWVFFFQNVIFNPRHIMPLLLPLLLLIAYGFYDKRYILIAGVLMLTVNLVITLTLVDQHSQPTAIAQAAALLRKQCNDDTVIASTELINYYLSSMGIRCRFIDVVKEREMLFKGDHRKIITVGKIDIPGLGKESAGWKFYHNPYVNRIWAEIEVKEFTR